MKKIPKSVNEHIHNARYYLEASEKHPAPTRNAVLILLLLVAWENIVIADEELGAWAKETIVDQKLYKSHATKLDKVPNVTRVIIGPKGAPPNEIDIYTGKDFEKLRMECQYGTSSDSKDVSKIFQTGWHLDNLRNGLINKIDWVEMMHKIYSELEDTETKK